MKKVLLLAALAVSSLAASAGVDPATYEDFQGFTMNNVWLKCNYVDAAAWNAIPIDGPDHARTSCIVDDKIYIVSNKKTNAEGGLDDLASIIELDLFSGEVLRKIELTLDGQPYGGLLAANQIGVDDYNNIWICGYVASTYNEETQASKAITPYVVDIATGALTAVESVYLPADESEAAGRLDYYDCVGDITGKQDRCVFMSPVASGTDLFVLGWQREQGGEWTPFMNDGDYVAGIMMESYPAEQSSWSGAPTVTIVKDEDFTGDMFYIDSFVTAPSLYTSSGSMIESFESCPDLAPKVGCNGVAEFSLAGNDFIAYVIEQYVEPEACRINICKLGEGMSFEGMELAYTLPEGGLGSISDSGARYHSIGAKVVADSNGKEAAYILTHKGHNGVGVYVMAEAGFDRSQFEAGVQAVEINNANAPIEYYNLQGMRVGAENLAPGFYITRQGRNVSKVIIK